MKKAKKVQFNFRLPVEVHAELVQLARARGMKNKTRMALALIDDWIANRCRRCNRGLAAGSTPINPKPCKVCFGSGRKDVAKAMREAGRSMRKIATKTVGKKIRRRSSR